ncbi:MAG: M23 family metallopeptidase [Chloroflexota bacterium]|nr:M23 family metallopeptidase [Chloroflexota bacterium]
MAVSLACTPITHPSEEPDGAVVFPNDPPLRALPSDPLRCTDRASIPQIDNAFDAKWAEDSNSIAVSRIVTIANPRTITGSEEDQRISIVNIARGTVRDLGEGSKPAWSGSGTFLSYWREGDEDLRIVRDGALVGLAPSTQPDVRWVGDALYFFHNGEIRVWKDGLSWTVANVLPELEPKYPKDDVYFSADGQRFTMTRYLADGDAERYLGVTGTGVMEPLSGEGTLLTQWSPTGHELLLRSATTLSLRAEDGSTQTAALRSLPGAVHGWTADGRLIVGAMSPTMPGSTTFDTFAVLGESSEVAALPNLLGVRTFSPDGRWFMGVTRTGLYSTVLEVYRCGALMSAKADPRADTVARARAAVVAGDPRHFVRPVSGAISQYLQGSHTGVDVSAPVGAIIVAADDGVVDEVGWVPVGGRRVCVLHQGGLQSCDYHTSAPLVAVGDHVRRGQPVALIGMTGMTFGPHVHWEAKQNGKVVDPLGQ